jgi:Ca2+-binding RTX toxin-like protein
MIGGGLSDRLMGGFGDDTLIGGAGNDVLAGAEGTNKYVFAAHGGSDQILQTAGQVDGERAILQFTESTLSDLRVFIDGEDVVVQQVSGALVRIQALATGVLNNWQVLDSGGQLVSIASLMETGQPGTQLSLEDRREAFLTHQRMQLANPGSAEGAVRRSRGGHASNGDGRIRWPPGV